MVQSQSELPRTLIGDLAAATALGLAIGVGTYVLLCGFAITPFTRLGLVLAIQAGWLYLALAGARTDLTPDRPHFSCRAAIGVGLLAAGVMATLGILYDLALRFLFSTTPTIGPWGVVPNLKPIPAILVVAMGVVVGPAAEERFFRGFLYGCAQRAGWPRLGATISALLFAACRLDPVNFIAYIGMGLLLAWLYWRTGTLVTTWTAHTVTNALMFALLFSGYE